MLERLDEIDWGSLTHAYGEATDVPDLIRQLAAPDSETRQEAIYELYGNIWHQGTVYKATAFAVPFLVELLQQPSLPDRHEVAGLLRDLAEGSSYLDVHGQLDGFRQDRRIPEFQTKLRRELTWVKAVHDAVVAGVDAYLALAEDEDDDLRAVLPCLLAVCRERTSRIEPLLQRLATEDHCGEVRASALLALLRIRQANSREGRATEPLGRLAPFFRRYFEGDDQAPLVRLVAAQCFLEASDEWDFDEAIAVAWPCLRTAREAYEGLHWNQGEDPFSNLARALNKDRSAQRTWIVQGLQTPELADQALDVIDEIALESRSFSAMIAPVLIDGLPSAKGDFRSRLLATLTSLGEPVIPLLKELRETAQRPLLSTIDAAMKTIGERRAEFRVERWLRPPKLDLRWNSGAALVQRLVDQLLPQQRKSSGKRKEIILRLGQRGPRASLAVVALRSLLDDPDQWIRVYSAWALWQIERDPATIMPLLLGEIQCRPVGFIALDLLADIGPQAKEAIPRLQGHIESDLRSTTLGDTRTWNHEDDMFRAHCHRTLAKIQEADL